MNQDAGVGIAERSRQSRMGPPMIEQELRMAACTVSLRRRSSRWNSTFASLGGTVASCHGARPASALVELFDQRTAKTREG